MTIPYDFDATLRDWLDQNEQSQHDRRHDIIAEVALLEQHRQAQIPTDEDERAWAAYYQSIGILPESEDE